MWLDVMLLINSMFELLARRYVYISNGAHLFIHTAQTSLDHCLEVMLQPEVAQTGVLLLLLLCLLSHVVHWTVQLFCFRRSRR